jgi:hypothetical protein
MMPNIESRFFSSLRFLRSAFSHVLQYTAIRSALAVDLLNIVFSLNLLHFGHVFPSIVYFIFELFPKWK